MPRSNWSALKKQQVGAYFEYFVKMEFTRYGFEVYTPEVDDRGIDFVARREGGAFVEVQVKALRDYGYAFLRKAHFTPRHGLYVAVGLLIDEHEPGAYLVPSTVWCEPNHVFVDREYDKPGQKSKPEWGLNVSRKNMGTIEPYAFSLMLETVGCTAHK